MVSYRGQSSALILLIHSSSVNRWFLLRTTGGTGVCPSSHWVRGRNTLDESPGHTHTIHSHTYNHPVGLFLYLYTVCQRYLKCITCHRKWSQLYMNFKLKIFILGYIRKMLKNKTPNYWNVWRCVSLPLFSRTKTNLLSLGLKKTFFLLIIKYRTMKVLISGYKNTLYSGEETKKQTKITPRCPYLKKKNPLCWR